jgi:flagellar motor switch/type III secretory pathway protein FliN
MPAPATTQPSQSGPVAVAAVENALLPLPPEAPTVPPLQLSRSMVKLPVELDVSVAVREFRVRNLLALAPGQVIETEWGHGQDVPLASGDVQLAWSEFEVVDSQLAVRVTRLT